MLMSDSSGYKDIHEHSNFVRQDILFKAIQEGVCKNLRIDSQLESELSQRAAHRASSSHGSEQEVN